MPEELDQARIVAAIQSATSEVFSTMLAMETTAKEAYHHAGKPEPTNGVVALIGLTGKWMGTGSICCTAELAREISGHLLMAEFASVDQEVLDAIGEVTNMIVGSFKNALEDYLGPMGLSIPVVIFGHNFMASSIHTVDWVVVPFACGSGQMEVKVCLAPQPRQQYNRRASDHQVPTSQVTL
jgi:chemotaxis protein CheX